MKAKELIGKVVMVPVFKDEGGLSRIVLTSKKIKDAALCLGDYKIIFEDEPKKTYLWSEILQYNKEEDNEKDKGYRALKVANGWYQIIPRPIPFDGRWH